MIFGSEDILPVYEFLQTYLRVVTSLNEYVAFDDDDDEIADLHKDIEKIR